MNSKTLKAHVSLVCTVCACFVFMAAPFVFAQEKLPAGFNTDLRYDVYFATGEGQVNVVKSVKLGEPVNLFGKAFLVVVTQDLRSDKGYVLMEALVAILPTNLSVETKGAG